jgi:hypothetical protein
VGTDLEHSIPRCLILSSFACGPEQSASLLKPSDKASDDLKLSDI